MNCASYRSARRPIEVEVSPTSAEQVRRANRIRLLLMALGVAAILVAGLVAVSRLGGDKPTADAPRASDLDRTAALVNRWFAGISQSGAVLGDPKAPVTLIEFADLQCPYCAFVATEGALPEVIDRYVRTGKINIELKLTKALGPDSVKAASVGAAAAEQDRMWQFAELFFFNQGAENSGYVTPAYLRSIATRVKGLDAARGRGGGQPAGARPDRRVGAAGDHRERPRHAGLLHPGGPKRSSTMSAPSAVPSRPRSGAERARALTVASRRSRPLAWGSPGT